VLTIRSAATILLAAAGAAVTTGAAGAAAGTPVAASAWHVAKTVPGRDFPLFSAVTASSAGNAWAFEAVNGKRPVAWHLSGSRWSMRAFPGKNNETVVFASSSSAANVWAFTSSRQALRWNGHGWTVVRKFTKSIGSGLVISRTDAWVFGEPFVPGAGLGSWHFNGRRWTHPASGRGLFGASALAPNSIWAYGTKTVAHWNGRAWASTSVASLLPKNTPLCGSRLSGILAVSAASVWAIGTGGCQDQGGPFVLLHFNGASWSQVALRQSLGAPEAIIGDGRGGLWIPVLTGFPGDGTIEHFSGGSLSTAALPIGPLHLALFGAAIGRRTTAALAVGYSRKSFSASTTTAVILRFGT
jgi:hypothetical protein